MRLLVQLLLLVALSGLIGADSTSNIQRRGQKKNIDKIKNDYPGINWKEADKSCDDDQFDRLVESTRMAVEVTNGLPDRVWESAAWNRYFLAEPKAYTWNPAHSWIGNQTMYQAVIYNLERVSRYPTEGGRNDKGRLVSGFQATYTCKDYTATENKEPRCSPPPGKDERGEQKAWSGPTAFTMPPDYGPNDLGVWAITFCPRFFQDPKIQPINDRTDGKKKGPKDFPNLHTHESAVIHEWMHISTFGYLPYTSRTTIIEDVKNSGLYNVGDDTIMYGDYWAYKFARKYMNDYKNKIPGGGANCETAINADSYALMFVYNWFAQTWSWSGDGSENVAFKREEEAIDEVAQEETMDLSSIKLDNASFPNDCRLNDENNPLDVTCDFVKAPAHHDVHHDDGMDTHCDQTKTSGLPAGVFMKGMYKYFCEKVDKNDSKKSLTQLVNFQGDEKKSKRSLGKRTPPAKPDAYKNAWAYLTFEKKSGDEECAASCSDAFKYIANSPCGTTGSGMSSMSTEGSVGVGCGIYRYQIHKGNSTASESVTHLPDPTLGKRHCYKKNQFGSTDLSNSKTIQKFNEFNADICEQALNDAGKSMNHESKAQVLDKEYEGTNFHFSISWKDGCKSPQALNPLSPLSEYGDSIRALDLFKGNAISCDDNDSAGGYIDAGCLRYDFKQEKS